MELILTNKNGQSLDLLHNPSKFVLVGCDALHGVDTDIADVSSPYIDGTIVESVKAQPRGISLTFALIPDIRNAIDFFTAVVKSKQWVTLTEKENGREITIEGIATIPPYTRMMGLCKIQLDIYCPQPYWQDAEFAVQAISSIIPLLYFPSATGQYFTKVNGFQGGRTFGAIDTKAEKSFFNDGDTSVGMNIYITALDAVTNPCIVCSTGDQQGWMMWLDLSLDANDEVIIDTTKGEKSITINGSDEYDGNPVLSYLRFTGTDWLQLETGENTFNIGEWDGSQISVSDKLYFTIKYRRRYE